MGGVNEFNFEYVEVEVIVGLSGEFRRYIEGCGVRRGL